VKTAIDGSGYARGGSRIGVDLEVAGCNNPEEALQILRDVFADLREAEPGPAPDQVWNKR